MKTINERMKELCEAKGLHFRPWEFPRPWEMETDEPCPYSGSIAADWWPKAQALRTKLIEELER